VKVGPALRRSQKVLYGNATLQAEYRKMYKKFEFGQNAARPTLTEWLQDSALIPVASTVC
jgi:hypothetical protein